MISHQVGSYTELRELLILQDINNGLPVSLRVHLEDRNIRTIEDAGIPADDYVLINKSQALQGTSTQ